MTWVDISFAKDGSVLKQSSGSGRLLASEACRVTLEVKSVVANGSCILAKGETLHFTLGDGEVCDALEYVSGTMACGEDALVKCATPRMAVDKKLGLPPTLDTPIVFEVSMLGFEQGLDKQAMTDRDKLDFALGRKAIGAQLFKDGRLELAFQRYSAVAKFLDYIDTLFADKDARLLAKDIKIACHLNRAACALKLGDPARAAICCTCVLAHIPHNVKALFRRASASIELGKYEEAARDLKRLLEIEPQNIESRRMLAKVHRHQHEAEKELCEKMFSPRLKRGSMASGLARPPQVCDGSVITNINGNVCSDGLGTLAVETDIMDSCLDESGLSEVTALINLDSPNKFGVSYPDREQGVEASQTNGNDSITRASTKSSNAEKVGSDAASEPPSVLNPCEEKDESTSAPYRSGTAITDPALEPFSVRLARFRGRSGGN
eukprot:TRINITY_DN62765_c0_g1_i1.p1 TRINITY_DN62765_c0_g1~~TRINITY_DN62765_c0_g1_i1.p1  ORF type:complete len:436 (-),score=61.68 TRINITY_DN62765_c0_g1_i1:18-1325(-)